MYAARQKQTNEQTDKQIGIGHQDLQCKDGLRFMFTVIVID